MPGHPARDALSVLCDQLPENLFLDTVDLLMCEQSCMAWQEVLRLRGEVWRRIIVPERVAPRLTDEGLTSLLERSSNSPILVSLRNCSQVSGVGLASLLDCRSIRYLDLYGAVTLRTTQPAAVVVKSFAKSLKRLVIDDLFLVHSYWASIMARFLLKEHDTLVRRHFESGHSCSSKCSRCGDPVPVPILDPARERQYATAASQGLGWSRSSCPSGSLKRSFCDGCAGVFCRQCVPTTFCPACHRDYCETCRRGSFPCSIGNCQQEGQALCHECAPACRRRCMRCRTTVCNYPCKYGETMQECSKDLMCLRCKPSKSGCICLDCYMGDCSENVCAGGCGKHYCPDCVKVEPCEHCGVRFCEFCIKGGAQDLPSYVCKTCREQENDPEDRDFRGLGRVMYTF
eukprot:TRINITY_DN27246_c0_g1_i2.p1 TRINITY_DN27246_c0_g1~~TRINITY_DN27246_c0_g1_i2.p1  ORF type:complete len:429 (-),score=5.38 TRINITY_DN27246_c0_g1_i2:274-1473(-)